MARKAFTPRTMLRVAEYQRMRPAGRQSLWAIATLSALAKSTDGPQDRTNHPLLTRVTTAMSFAWPFRLAWRESSNQRCHADASLPPGPRQSVPG